MPNTKGIEPEVPAAELWQSPLVWTKAPQGGGGNLYCEFPEDAIFVRAQILMTLSKETGPGMWNQAFKTLPSLLRVERGKPLEIHFTGLDGGCWTYRLTREGRKSRWKLFAGSAWPAGEEIAGGPNESTMIERVEVQSLIGMRGSGKYISFAIRADGSMENYGKAVDPDPDD